MGKSLIIKRIHNAAHNYKNHFIGNTYMFVYDNQYFEVQFKKSSFLHLTGIGTKLNAEDFYKHAMTPKGLKPNEIFLIKYILMIWQIKKQQFLINFIKSHLQTF